MVIKTPIYSFDEAVEWIEKSPMETREKICFLFKGSKPKCDDVYDAIYRIKRIFPAFNSYKQFEIPIAETPYFFEENTIFDQRTETCPKISIVIPTRGRPDALKACLGALCVQSIGLKDYEIIVVEDGADGETSLEVLEIRRRIPDLNLMYIQVERTSQFFHAGLVRNVGCSYIKGKVLLFLDGDIIVPKDLLDDIWQKHQNYDVIQYPRKHVYPDGNKIEISAYWERFYRETKNWAKLDLFWKYISTSCLSIKMEQFKQCGGFNTDFTSYGFEDTYLGYQLSYLTHRWGLGNLWTEHLLQPGEDPIAVQNPFRKKVSLQDSAKTFFLLTKDTDFYYEFFALMGDRPNLRWFTSKICFHLKIHWIFFFVLNLINIISKPWLLKKYLGHYVYRPIGLYLRRPFGLYVERYLNIFWGYYVVRPFGLYVRRPIILYLFVPALRFFGKYVQRPLGIYVSRPFGIYIRRPFGDYISRPIGIYIKKPLGSLLLGNLWIFQHPIAWFKQKFPKLYTTAIRPFEKSYYFCEYQFKKRFKGNGDVL